MLYSSFSRAIPAARQGAQQNHTGCLIPDFRGWVASANHSFHCLLQRKISVNFRTADDGGAKPETSRGAPFRLPYPAYPSVISAKTRRASIGQKAIAGCFSEDSLRNYMFKSHASKTGYIFNKSAAFFGDACTGTTAQTTSTTYRPARMNSRNLTNIAIHFPQRQLHYGASNH